VPEEERTEWVRRNRIAFDQVRAALTGPEMSPEWPDESLHARFLDAVAGLGDGTSGAADVAAIGAAVIRRNRALGMPTASLVVPHAGPWPTQDEWQASGALAYPEQGGMLRVWADHWRPAWMASTTGSSLVELDAAFERRLSSEQRPADPFFTAITGHKSYSSDGQRLAVRAVVTSANDSTTLVVLPTGGGKTAVAHVAALLADRRGTTLVIVPTIALALDQERAFRDLLVRTGRKLASEDFAYHSGLDEGARQSFRNRIREGEQKIVFAAPESVERSLAFSLYEAAEFALITAFVVDEAHVVSEWGDEFRPEFQSVGGLRRGLLRAAEKSQSGPFRTLLLTATPTQDAVETLRVAFSDPTRPFGVVGAPELRLEPTYWAHEFPDDAERLEAVIEAIRHLPRPMLLYTTTRDDAVRCEQIIRASGFSRVALVNGDTPAARRREVLNGWRGERCEGQAPRKTRYDVVIATSAFGLGVDQEDVRAVVHTCIPETVDRFYQEVGRGGRDGRVSLSLVLHCERDRDVARNINQTKLITRELAERRLRAMLATAQSLGGESWRVDLAALPSHTRHKRSYNLQWNQRTINLLARAGAVAWDGEKPDLRNGISQEESDPEAWGAVIRLLRADHQSSGFWEHVESIRTRRLRADFVSLNRMFSALDETANVHRTLRDTYAVTTDDGGSLEPAESCGGCPWCRKHNQTVLVGGAGTRSTVGCAVSPKSQLSLLTRERQAGIVLYHESDPEWWSKVADAVFRAVSMGAISVVLDPSAAEFDVSRLHKASPCSAAFVEQTNTIDLRDLVDVPTTFVFGPEGSDSITADLVKGGLLVPQYRLIIAGDTARDPSRTDRFLRDIHPSVSIESFLEAI
jgi:ATP-dependent DNA helicase RecQ